jgi:hypothetical protein
MKSKRIAGIAIFLFFTITLTNSASASFFDYFEEMYMTSEELQTGEQNSAGPIHHGFI